MKHILPDPEMEKEFDGKFTVYSCEFDNGKRASGAHGFIRLGEDGKVFLFLCQSCIEQLRGQILLPIVIDSIRDDKRMKEYISSLVQTAMVEAQK